MVLYFVVLFCCVFDLCEIRSYCIVQTGLELVSFPQPYFMCMGVLPECIYVSVLCDVYLGSLEEGTGPLGQELQLKDDMHAGN